MSYAYSYGFDRNQFDKYATIQDDVSDTYLHLVDDEQESEDSELAELDFLDIDELTDADVLTLSWEG